MAGAPPGVPAPLAGCPMWHDLGVALCLMLVLEGILPFLMPGRWRALVAALARVDDRTMRTMGFISMLVGTLLLYLIN